MESPARRPYTMRRRRAAIDETRARILDAAIGLYESIGPAETTMSAIAMRAGVTRATLYRHFASEGAVADAVVATWREAWPSFDAGAVAGAADDAARARATLAALYAGYRATEALTGSLVRDAHALPSASRAAVREPASVAARTLGDGSVAVRHAVAFETWRSLRDAGLADGEIADLMAKFIALGPVRSGRAGRATRTQAPQGAAPVTASVARAEPPVAGTGARIPDRALDSATRDTAVRPGKPRGKAKEKTRREKAGTKKKGKGDRKARA